MKRSEKTGSGAAGEKLPLHEIPSWFGRFHLLADGPRSVLIDAGFFGERGRLRRLLARLGLGPRDLAAIVLTHGHLDHVGNLAWLREWTNAPVYAHPAEQAHVDGKAEVRGAARIGGWLEALGRGVLRYRAVGIDVPIADGDVLPFWGGLRVVHLPGHTTGHCGYYSLRHDVLFAGDLFANYGGLGHLPPAVFNSEPHRIPASLAKAAAVGAARVVPNHQFSADWEGHAAVLRRLAERHPPQP